ncbi:MAG: hypothetical protein CMC68_04540 [Flavobacteriaceae bacterium]|nr:hypothetical protein [Flavobacteriaceae bacterium]|tara:strand:- start:885 stop:1481 length:597 start_codon:yes stop_codon:yes gene_type:complete
MKTIRRNNISSNRFKIVFPILTIIGIGIFAITTSFYEKSWFYDWDGINYQIRDSILVAQYEGISSGSVGISPRKPKQFDRRHWSMKNATVSELQKLTEYPNGTIKTIAYEGLIRKKEFDKKTEFTIKAIKDTEYPIEYSSGCVGTPMYIGEYLVDFVLLINDESPPLPNGLKNQFNLTQNEIESIMTEFKKQPSLWKK